MNRWQELRFRISHEWHLVGLIATFALFLPLIVLFSRDPFNLAQPGGREVEARITSISNSRTRFQGYYPGWRVGAQTGDGIRGSTTALPPDMVGCEVGDRIKARQIGMKLYLEPRPCD